MSLHLIWFCWQFSFMKMFLLFTAVIAPVPPCTSASTVPPPATVAKASSATRWLASVPAVRPSFLPAAFRIVRITDPHVCVCFMFVCQVSRVPCSPASWSLCSCCSSLCSAAACVAEEVQLMPKTGPQPCFSFTHISAIRHFWDGAPLLCVAQGRGGWWRLVGSDEVSRLQRLGQHQRRSALHLQLVLRFASCHRSVWYKIIAFDEMQLFFFRKWKKKKFYFHNQLCFSDVKMQWMGTFKW